MKPIRNPLAGPIEALPRTTCDDVVRVLIDARGYQRIVRVRRAPERLDAWTCREKFEVRWDQLRPSHLPADLDGQRFDLVFLHGATDHDEASFAIRWALGTLSPGGVVVVSGCMPPSRVEEEPARCGTVWRALVKIRELGDVHTLVGDFDRGVALVEARTSSVALAPTKEMREMSYADFIEKREQWFSPVSAAELMARIRGQTASAPTVAVLVLGKSDDELAEFRAKSPRAEMDARIVYVANPGKRLGGYAAIANPFLDACTEDVVGVVHADTSFAEGALRVFARAALDFGGRLVGIVGRAPPRPQATDPFENYVWCNSGGGSVSTLDSCSVLFPRRMNLRFDGRTFDDFHCVVEDLCLQAETRGVAAFVPAVSAGHVGNGGAGDWRGNHRRYHARLLAKWRGRKFYTT